MSSNNLPAYWDSTCLGIAFPWWKCPGEITLHAYHSLPHDFLVRNLSESLRNATLKTHYTPHSFVGLFKIIHHITIVVYFMISLKICSDIVECFPCCFFHLLSWSSNFTSCINYVTRGTTTTLPLILASYPVKLIFQIPQSSAFWTHTVLTNLFMSSSLKCNRGK